MESIQRMLIAWILYGFCYGINSSKNKISMNWSITDGDLILICHVEDLFLQVEFLHDSKSFQAYCLPPYPSPMCTSYNDGTITQDPKTNCTKLVLSSTITSYFSFWSCNHGLNGDTSNQIFVEKEGDDNTMSRVPSLDVVNPLLIALIVVFVISTTTVVVFLWYKLRRQEHLVNRKDTPMATDLESHLIQDKLKFYVARKSTKHWTL